MIPTTSSNSIKMISLRFLHKIQLTPRVPGMVHSLYCITFIIGRMCWTMVDLKHGVLSAIYIALENTYEPIRW
ncbi:predicted protein [Lichtheimia corymbifera JMRC:FSU:9682]|uniref:Uncharacterized protein n=1 Tax=Lichtheimia corymbifera JMRC:FSU:9682 TaxID=1263082 RepID=A0A068SHV3_9FUNG|nr:predicted protein [Lichtheimia corymbifera JMRC:FSU:9682]